MKVTNQNYYMDGYIAKNLDFAVQQVKKDWDFVILITGIEGGGKSLLAQQVAYYCDQTFNIKRIAYTLQGFETLILNGKKGQAIVLDETMHLLNSRAAMTRTNRRIVELLAECRQKNLFIILVLPSLFDLDKYASLHRASLLLHVYTGKGMQRGYVKAYDRQRIKNLIIKGTKTRDYSVVRPNFRGRFGKHYTVPEKEYKKVKEESLKRSRVEKPDDKRRRLDAVLYHLHRTLNYTSTRIKELCGMPPSSIHDACKRHEEELKHGSSFYDSNAASMDPKVGNLIGGRVVRR